MPFISIIRVWWRPQGIRRYPMAYYIDSCMHKTMKRKRYLEVPSISTVRVYGRPWSIKRCPMAHHLDSCMHKTREIKRYLKCNYRKYSTVICIQYHKKGWHHHIYWHIFLRSNAAILYLFNQVKSIFIGGDCKTLREIGGIQIIWSPCYKWNL